jgi:hypothetical protein
MDRLMNTPVLPTPALHKKRLCLVEPSRYISGDSMSSLLWLWHGDNTLLPNLGRWWN